MNNSRIFELDLFRGLAIFIMILVDAPPANIYEILQHAQWEGLTIADFAFPFFVFAMGASAAVSSSRKIITWSKIFRRAVLLFLIGLIFNETGYIFAYLFIKNFTGADFYNSAIEHLRLFGILQRLALTYAAGMAITKFLTTNKEILSAAFVFLILSSLGFHVYAAENPFDEVNNISSAVDLFFPSVNHIYTPTGDPEGLYGTIASMASMLFGFFARKILIDNLSSQKKIYQLMIFGVVILITGELWSFVDIIAKKIWTAPFVLLTTGSASILIAAFIFLFNITPNIKKFFHPLTALGKNPLLIFMASNITVVFLIVIDVWTRIFETLQTFLPNTSCELQATIYQLIWATLWIFIAILLNRLKIIVKL